MSWYKTYEEAEKACKEKEIKYFPEKFIVLIDEKEKDCYWAQRIIDSAHEQRILKQNFLKNSEIYLR